MDTDLNELVRFLNAVFFTGEEEEIIDSNVGRIGEASDAVDGKISELVSKWRNINLFLQVKPVCLISRFCSRCF